MLRAFAQGLYLCRLGTAVPQQLASSARRAASGAALQRGEQYAQLSPDDVAYFRGVLGERGVITDPDALEPYNSDWMRKYSGRSRLALRPATTDQVSRILARCDARRLAVVPQGGNTGLVGGSVPVFDEVVISLGAMNKIISFDEASGVLVAQAGCVLQALDEYVGERGFIMPLDLGAKGSCQIGGNVSTNAGGLRLLRYGSLHGSVLGVEAVTAGGRVLDLLGVLRKDNTGYDLKQLFIGAEGTLGIVTAVSIQCAPRPASVQLAFLSCPSFTAVTATLALARRRLGEVLSAVEFLDTASMDLVCAHLPGAANPLQPAGGGGGGEAGGGSESPAAAGGGDGSGGGSGGSGGAPFYMLIETHGSCAAHDEAKLEGFLEEAAGGGLVTDGALGASGAQAAAMWRVREGVSEALTRRGPVFKYDLSIPLPHMYDLVEEMRRRTEDLPGVEVVGYGHVGDGNLHLNISAPKGAPPAAAAALLGRVEPFVYEWTAARGGSISAEHGLGLMKAECIGYSKPAAAVELMGAVKRLLDPNGILNPYKVLPFAAAPGAAPGGA
ncbi:MAG: hypothetical protein J3K34DRAFT_453004 [Monoraphidium minutum]|nr:MAG: hypothetical protein J3K34DRAFT_453004 [Monoraphidium minutum]